VPVRRLTRGKSHHDPHHHDGVHIAVSDPVVEKNPWA